MYTCPNLRVSDKVYPSYLDAIVFAPKYRWVLSWVRMFKPRKNGTSASTMSGWTSTKQTSVTNMRMCCVPILRYELFSNLYDVWELVPFLSPPSVWQYKSAGHSPVPDSCAPESTHAISNLFEFFVLHEIFPVVMSTSSFSSTFYKPSTILSKIECLCSLSKTSSFASIWW